MKLGETIYVMCRESQSEDIKIWQAQKEQNYKAEIQMMIYDKL